MSARNISVNYKLSELEDCDIANGSRVSAMSGRECLYCSNKQLKL